MKILDKDKHIRQSPYNPIILFEISSTKRKHDLSVTANVQLHNYILLGFKLGFHVCKLRYYIMRQYKDNSYIISNMPFAIFTYFLDYKYANFVILLLRL